MKAVLQRAYGPPAEVLSVGDVDTPHVADGHVLVRVRAASLHPDVWHVVTGRPYVLRLMGAGLTRPRIAIPGTDVAGDVTAVGSNVTRVKTGDAVFGETISGMQWTNGGAFAEYVAVREDWLAHKPANVSFEQAATVATSGLIALNNLRGRAAIRSGMHVLVNGAAGGVGSIVVQLAKARGALVTGVDAGPKLEMVRSLGADHLIDYTATDFAAGTAWYDLIVDVASTRSIAECRRVLAPGGVYVLIGHDHFGKAGGRILGSLPRFFGLMARSAFDRHVPAPHFETLDKSGALCQLAELLASQQLTPVIDRAYPLSMIHDAMDSLVDAKRCGRIVITPSHTGRTQ